MTTHSIEEKYPEHAKLEKVSAQSQAIGEFLGFSGYTLCSWDEESEEYLTAPGSIEQILAKYYGIDLRKLEAEKQAMLNEIRGEAK